MRDDLKAAVPLAAVVEDIHRRRADRPGARHRRHDRHLLGRRRRGAPRRCRSTSTIGSSPSASGGPPGPTPGSQSRSAGSSASIAPQNYVDWAAQQQVFESIAAIAGGAVHAARAGGGAGGPPVAARHRRVLRRAARAAGDRPRVHAPRTRSTAGTASPSSATRFWRRRFGGDPTIIGRTIPLEGGSYEVVGVMPPDFAYPVGAHAPDRSLGPVRRPARRARSQSAAASASTCRRSRG